jgi:hypothetical protein
MSQKSEVLFDRQQSSLPQNLSEHPLVFLFVRHFFCSFSPHDDKALPFADRTALTSTRFYGSI